MRHFNSIAVVSSLFFLCTGIAHADDITGGSSIQPSQRQTKPIRLGDEDDTTTGNISGTCTILPSQGNPITSPCADLQLVLTDVNQVEIARTRTSSKGHFAFAADSSKEYRILPDSKLYEVATPKKPIRGGRKLELKLRQK